MSYLYYQHSTSNFGVAEAHEYKVEYFTEESERKPNIFHWNSLARITNYTQSNRKKLEGLIKQIFIPDEVGARYADGKKKYRTYDPLNDTPELYLELNKIKLFDEVSLLKFIKDYGIPFDKRLDATESEIIGPILLKQRNETNKFLIGMDVLMFYEELIKLQSSLKMWNNIKEDNIEEMENVIKQFKLFAEISLEGHSEATTLEELQHRDALVSSKEITMIWKQVKNSDIKTIALSFLNLELKKISSGETSTLFTNGKIVPAIKFNNLLEVAGYQLKQAIFKDEKLEVCANCGALFESRHASQRFCAPLPGRKRSTCENTYNQRQKRLRKKQGNTNEK